MSSPAQFLFDFFSAPAKAQNQRDFAPLYDATRLLEEQLEALKLVGARVSPFMPLITTMREELNRNCTRDMARVTVDAPLGCTLNVSDLALLELAVERTDLQPTISEQRKASIASLLEHVRTLVAEDESLDPQLRLFLARSIASVQVSLDEYEITGEFVLKEALIRLIGLFRVAESSSEDPNRWSGVWKDYGVPTVAGLIASIPQLALTTATLLGAISG